VRERAGHRGAGDRRIQPRSVIMSIRNHAFGHPPADYTLKTGADVPPVTPAGSRARPRRQERRRRAHRARTSGRTPRASWPTCCLATVTTRVFGDPSIVGAGRLCDVGQGRPAALPPGPLRLRQAEPPAGKPDAAPGAFCGPSRAAMQPRPTPPARGAAAPWLRDPAGRPAAPNPG